MSDKPARPEQLDEFRLHVQRSARSVGNVVLPFLLVGVVLLYVHILTPVRLGPAWLPLLGIAAFLGSFATPFLCHRNAVRALRQRLGKLPAVGQAAALHALRDDPDANTRRIVRALLRQLPVGGSELTPTAPTSRGDEHTPAGEG